jgi:hypothetical protein
MTEYKFYEREFKSYPFKSAYNKIRTESAIDEKNNEEKLTIDAGYVDPQKQIQQMILAGEKLNSIRIFDEDEALTNEEFADEVSRIRHPNTDIIEIYNYTDMVNDRIQKSKSEAERRAIKESVEKSLKQKTYEKKEEDPTEEPKEEPKKS